MNRTSAPPSADFSAQDREYMTRALRLARRGRGSVEPNPMVGCVLVRNRRIVGEGYHRRFGGPHAEIEALRQAAAQARGATAYVTLEPCSHFGKTPPCSDALIEAGVGRVIAAHEDPFPAVSGRGLAALQQAGIAVQCGLCGPEAAALNAPFLTRVLQGRPYVILKWAQSLDGKIATRTGHSQWISGPPARCYVHRLRARVDAVVVGIGTVLRDDPQLTARDVRVRRVARRVVFDGRLRIPLNAELVRTSRETPTVVITTAASAKLAKRARLEQRGVEVLGCRSRAGKVSVLAALHRLASRGWTNLLVEGGGQMIGAFFDASVVDEAHVFTAPIIIGGQSAPSACAGAGVERVDRARSAGAVERRNLGADQLTILRFQEVLQQVTHALGFTQTPAIH